MKRRVVDAKRCIKGWFNALAINSSHAFLALLVFLAGVRAMFFPSQLATNSLAILLPHWAFIPWSLLLIAGGALIFFGVATRFPALERSGIISVLGAGAIGIFALVIFPAGIYQLFIWAIFCVVLILRYIGLRKIEMKDDNVIRGR